MGLDMYLLRKTNFYYGTSTEPGITIKNNNYNIQARRISEISEEVGYWRKFNALHNWFVTMCQDGNDDCGTHYVSRENLEDLHEALQLIVRNNPKVDGKYPIVKKEMSANPKNMLPTKEGFFFGSTDYDDNYFDDVENAFTVITNLLSESQPTKPHGTIGPVYQHFYYRSSW
tara:strand:+ start:528 stop:1043 length:516 start_codon:yes stop_codon:yes gene_type:complete